MELTYSYGAKRGNKVWINAYCKENKTNYNVSIEIKIKEKESLNSLANNTFIPVLEKYFKKSCINKALNEEYEEHEEEIYEYLEDIFSDMLMTYFKKFNTELKQTIEIKEPEAFYCCKWE